MIRYTVIVVPAAEKLLLAVRDRVLRRRLDMAIHRLGDDPRPVGVVKMVGYQDRWRVRVGEWRIVYRIDDGVLVVLVVTVAPRGGVYR